MVIKDYAYQMTEIDHIFFLTDLDSFRSELQSILADQKETPYQWIISNPCFEIWLYYSYFSDDPSEKLKKLLFLSEEKRPNKLKTLNNKLLPGGIDPRKAFDEMETAIKNACTYWPGADKYNIPKLFGTQIYFLAEQIWSRIEKEFKKNRADSFKRGLLIP